MEKLDPTSKDEVISSISGVGISFRNNAVNLYVVTSEANARPMNFLQKVKKEISPFDHIQVMATSGKDVPCASVEPGTEMKNGTFSRSVGFWAYDANNNLGLITAPHDSAAAGDTMKIGICTFGTAGTPSYSGSVDAVFIERTNTYFTATRYVSGWGFNLTSNGHTTLAVGSTTYSKGITSGCHMGEVVDINYTTSYGISDCVVTNAPCESGDSGGIVAGSGNSSSRFAAGIVTGKQGGTGYVIYVKAGNILNALNVSVY